MLGSRSYRGYSYLRDAGQIVYLTAHYPDFPMSCGWGEDNCITIVQYLNSGVRSNINNGYESREEVKQDIESELSLLLAYPGVSISCISEPR